MKKIILLLSIFIIWGCGSRKVDNTKLKQEETKNEFTEDKQHTEIQSETQGESSAKAERKDLNISIEPIAGNYWFKYGGIEFNGNAKVTVNSSDEKKEEQTKVKEVIKTVIDRYVKNITVTTYKSIYTHKNIDKKALPWWGWVIFGAIIYVAGIFTIPLIKYYTNNRIKLKS